LAGRVGKELGKWSLLGFRKGYSIALLWVGDALDPVAAKFLSDQKTYVLEEKYRAGAVPNFSHVAVIWRKPL
jgi:hypothetical protein